MLVTREQLERWMRGEEDEHVEFNMDFARV